MEVDFIPGQSLLWDNAITLDYGNYSLDFVPYFAQPPIVSQTQVMGLVTDSQSPQMGPAWFFQVPYDKVVVLPASALTAPSNSKRQTSEGQDQSSSSFTQRKGTVQLGDLPWVCYWNGTLLEAFIYVNQTSSWGRSSSSSSSYSSTPTSTSYRGESSTTYNPSAQSTSSSYSDPNFLPIYPRVVKVEERRVPKGMQSITPYCKSSRAIIASPPLTKPQASNTKSTKKEPWSPTSSTANPSRCTSTRRNPTPSRRSRIAAAYHYCRSGWKSAIWR